MIGGTEQGARLGAQNHESPLLDELDAPMHALGYHRAEGSLRYELNGIPAWAWQSDEGWKRYLDTMSTVDA